MASYIDKVLTEDGATPNLSVSGVYTPVLTNTTNIDASTARLCSYCRVGNIVIVSGQVDVTGSAAAATELTLSLPVESNLADAYQLGGVGASADGKLVLIEGDATADAASFQWATADTNEHTVSFIFSYQQTG